MSSEINRLRSVDQDLAQGAAETLLTWISSTKASYACVGLVLKRSAPLPHALPRPVSRGLCVAASTKIKQISNSDELFASIGACMEHFPDNEVIIQCLISVVLTLGASSRGALCVPPPLAGSAQQPRHVYLRRSVWVN